MSDRPIVILGAGGFAREVLDVIEAISATGDTIEAAGFIVDSAYLARATTVNGLPVLGDFDWLDAHASDVRVLCGVGDPSIRRRMVERATRSGTTFATVVHPRATSSSRVELGMGVVITAGVVMTNNIVIGDHVHVNLNCTIGHDAVLGPFATLAPGVHVSGNVTVGEGAYIGTGAVILETMSVGRWSIVGAGAVVNRDVPSDTTAVGLPAKVIKQRAPGWHLE